MAIKFLTLALFFAFVVIKPVHDRFAGPDDDKHKKPHNDTTVLELHSQSGAVDLFKKNGTEAIDIDDGADYLWMYLVFAYFFTGLVLYLVIAESKRIIQIRQDYLGSQSTITDRTIRLSGIPEELQEEGKIKDFIEELEIGKVDSVLLVRDWSSLDLVVDERDAALRKLERALVENEQHLREERSFEGLPTTSAGAESDREDSHLLNASDDDEHGRRPLARLWIGRFSMKYKYVDAIDYHQERLRRLDEKIEDLRGKDFPARPLAFVTMDSVASCQMAVQAVLDSSPLQLIATPSPSPSDITWSNTYLPPMQQMARSWTITAIITVLTLWWSIILVPIAGLIDLNTIHKIFPQFAEFLDAHPFGKSLVQTQLPTLVVSLLNVLVPYLYSWLSYQQGIVSQGDVELSVISKNFFFTFFNFFIVFTALGTASLSFENFGNESLRETANKLAQSISDLRQFYVNYIILQALALFPLRLLEFGSVSLYPFGMLTAKTPRGKFDRPGQSPR
jgi:calcium permeable stress-gated cation channel